MARWRRDGRELLYVDLQGRLQSVDVSVDDDTIDSSRPTALFDMPIAVDANLGLDAYDISPDGERFLVLVIEGGDTRDPIAVVDHWFSELESLLATD